MNFDPSLCMCLKKDGHQCRLKPSVKPGDNPLYCSRYHQNCQSPIKIESIPTQQGKQKKQELEKKQKQRQELEKKQKQRQELEKKQKQRQELEKKQKQRRQFEEKQIQLELEKSMKQQQEMKEMLRHQQLLEKSRKQQQELEKRQKQQREKSPLDVKDRLVPVVPNHKHLNEQFIENNLMFMTRNQSINKNLNDKFRIMTYNVHMWQGIIGQEAEWSGINDPYMNNFKNIYRTIRDVDPDLLCLQEVMYDTNLMAPLLSEYIVISACAVTPSNYANMLYMVMMLIKKKLKDVMHLYNPQNFADIFPEYREVCVSPTNCLLGAETMVLEHDIPFIEKKCFVSCLLPGLNIIDVHLTAYDKTGQLRMNEIDQIDQFMVARNHKGAAPEQNRDLKSIILGDFNMINPAEYNDDPRFQQYITRVSNKYGLITPEYQHTTTKKWLDLYSILSHRDHTFMNYSNWTGFRVDHVFGKNISQAEMNHMTIHTYYSNASDHNPLVLDIDLNIVFPHLDTKDILTNMKPMTTVLAPHGTGIKKLIIDYNAFCIDQLIDGFTKVKPGGIIDLTPIINKKCDTKSVLFNVQPVAGIDWFSYDDINKNDGKIVVKHEYELNDPFFTGTDVSKNLFGVAGGVYVTPNYNYLSSLSAGLQKSYYSFSGIEMNQEIDVRFIFSLRSTQELDIIDIGNDFGLNRDYYYDHYDILSSSTYSKNYLITRKNLHKRGNVYVHDLLQLEYVLAYQSLPGMINETLDNVEQLFQSELKKIQMRLPSGCSYGKKFIIRCIPFDTDSILMYQHPNERSTAACMILWENPNHKPLLGGRRRY